MGSETRLVSQETDLDIKKVRKSKANVAIEIATSPQKIVTVSLCAPQWGCSGNGIRSRIPRFTDLQPIDVNSALCRPGLAANLPGRLMLDLPKPSLG